MSAKLNPDIISTMNSKRFFLLLALISLLSFGLWLPVSAAPGSLQQILTPTPGADGRIIYTVQPGDSCIKVALLNNISLEQLRQLNSKLDANCTLVAGDELLIGIVSLAGTPTAGPSPTPAPPTITPTPFTGTTDICVLLFEDSNGNAIRETTEPAIAGGAVSVTEINGEYSSSQQTVIPGDPTVYQGICFSNVPEGSYNITVGIPDNYNPTMNLNSSLVVKAGDRAEVGFGAQSKEVTIDPGAQQPEPGGKSPIIGILGGMLLLGGAVLGYYAWRSGRPDGKFGGGLKRK